MAFWGAIMGLMALLQGGLKSSEFAVLAVIVGALIFICYLPYFFWMLRKIWFFPGEGTPISLDQLKKEILSINRADCPVMVEEKNPTHFILTWKYVDAKWWELFRKRGLQSVYRLHLKFKPEKHEVIMVDKFRSVDWGAGPNSVRFKWKFFTGIMMEVSIGRAWGIRENFTLGKIYDYNFDNMEIKNPVFNTILRSGWNVRFGGA